jgi:hypothetical protein
MEVIAHGALFTWMMGFAVQGASQYFAGLCFDWRLAALETLELEMAELVTFVPETFEPWARAA